MLLACKHIYYRYVQICLLRNMHGLRNRMRPRSLVKLCSWENHGFPSSFFFYYYYLLQIKPWFPKVIRRNISDRWPFTKRCCIFLKRVHNPLKDYIFKWNLEEAIPKLLSKWYLTAAVSKRYFFTLVKLIKIDGFLFFQEPVIIVCRFER